jgi:hypothetical protein
MMTTTENTKRSRRTDVHRPGAIVPANYEQVTTYSLATMEAGWPVPSIGITCELDRRVVDADGKIVRNGEHDAHGECCTVAIHAKAHAAGVRVFGCPGKCGVCGAAFIYGSVWKHIPTGEYVHLGHDCADKYELLVDASAWELANGRVRAAAARECAKARNAEERAAFLAKHEGLAEALQVEHHIIADIAARFQSAHTLSEKQVALVLKLAHEVKNPKPAETHVPAPTGKTTFTGEIVSVKTVESQYGLATKVTVKVTTDAGVWLAWGTCPAKLFFDEEGRAIELRGRKAEFTATLEAGREPHFVFMKRPRAKLV